ncbi:Transglycosylase SLT domain protein [Variovorax sp. PBS-H4]|uniref:transglycosylase SLT domain-containing protein n=1 Tax=Variovorax sp. PBS-H4 TaxID=434008 RepID=UPI001316087F|nr:transglycosylase SLT domain-containing protein [Variovorax sp. PBS-H4]VTU38227.1 Transglycosylase SLT domain protein [Variovorax sp. PBS-H4]
MAGWGHALAAGVNGWMRGAEYVRQNEQAEKDAKWKDEQRDRQRKRDAAEDQIEQDLKNAARPVAVEEGAGGMVKPPEMDNRDVGLPENAALPNGGLQQGGFSVAGQTYADRAAADTAATKANAPEAVNARVAGAYRSNGKVDKAIAIESADRMAEVQKMQLADQRWKRDLGAAMRGGHAGLAQLASSSEAGPMAGLKVQPIVSEDGKSVTYAALDADGKATPIPGLPQFSNDQNGMIQAAWMLDRTVDPAARMAHFTQQQERDRAQKNSDRSYNQSERHFEATNSRADRAETRQGKLADVQIKSADLAYQEALRGSKIPQGVKMQVEGWREEAKTINAAITKAMADGTWDTNNPNAKELLTRQAVANSKISAALKPFMKDESTGADPFGLKKPQGTNAGANGGQGAGAGRGTVPNSYKDPVWDGAEVQASKKTGVPTEVMRIIRTVGERSNGDQVSPKGAKGVYQFMPATRDLFLKKYGVDAYSEDPEEQALAAAYHLKESYDRTGSWDKAMAGFNGGPTAERGTNGTKENRDYSKRTSMALAATDPARDSAAARASEFGRNMGKPQPPMASAAEKPAREQPAIDYTAMRAGDDPMAAVYQKQVVEMQKGLRTELSPDVAAWKQRMDSGEQRAGEQRFNAAQQAALQSEKLRAAKKDKDRS